VPLVIDGGTETPTHFAVSDSKAFFAVQTSDGKTALYAAPIR